MADSIFTKFGNIFKGGGIIQIAKRLLAGFSGKSLLYSLGERFAMATPPEFAMMVRMAEDSIEGGETWRTLDPFATPNPSILPENPALFGDDWFGKRALVVASITNEEDTDPMDIWLELSDISPWGEIEDSLTMAWSSLKAKYPEKFKNTSEEAGRLIAIRNVIAMKRF